MQSLHFGTATAAKYTARFLPGRPRAEGGGREGIAQVVRSVSTSGCPGDDDGTFFLRLLRTSLVIGRSSERQPRPGEASGFHARYFCAAECLLPVKQDAQGIALREQSLEALGQVQSVSNPCGAVVHQRPRMRARVAVRGAAVAPRMPERTVADVQSEPTVEVSATFPRTRCVTRTHP